MPTQVRFRRGTTAQNNNFTGASGEITVNTSNNTIRVHDGSTLGGTELATVTHVTNSIANVIDSAPALLDTLNEIAAAIGDDPGFYANVASLGGSALARANAAYDRANVGVTYAGAAFDKANTLVATVVGVSSTSISNTNILDGLKTVDGSSSGLDSDLLDGQDGSYYLDWTNTTNKPDPVITVSLTGNVTGSTSATLVDLASNSLSISTALAASGVSASTYGGSSKVPVFTVDSAGRITSAANVNVAGVSSFGASGNTFTISTADGGTFSASIQPDSVRLGTDTTGAYVANLVQGAGISLSGLGNEGATPTVALDASGVSASTYGGSSKVPVLTIDTYGRVTSAANVNVAGVTSFGASGNTFTIATADGGSFSASIQADSVRLGTDTTGAYVANLVAGTGVSLIGLANEGATPTIAIGQAVNTNSDVTFANVTVTGNLLVQGNAIEFSANTLVINDPLIQVGKNPAGDAVDLGFFGHYIGGSPSIERHAGLFRDATDGQFKLFTNLDPEPATIVDTANATYQSANLVVNFVVGKVTDISNHSTSGLSEGSNLYFTNARSRASLTGGTGISYDSSAGTITLSTSGVSASTYGGASTVPVYSVDTYGRITTSANVAIAISSGAVSGLAASATTDTTNASNITSGSLAVARLAASTISGITLGNNLNALSAGTGLSGTAYNGSATQTWTLATSGVTAATYGGSSTVPVYTVDTYGRLTSASNVSIAISSGAVSGLAASATTDTTSASNISSGTLPSARLSGSYTGITGVGTITAGTWNGTSISTTYTDAKVTSVNGSTGAVTGLATTAGKLSQFASTSSAELAGVISDETGSGALVFASSPTLVTPNLGTPSSIVLTNATGTASSLTAGAATNATNATNVAVTDDTSTNSTHYVTYVSATSGNAGQKVSSSKLTFNPSSGLLTSTDYNSSSDKRLKDDIQTVGNAIETVNKLRGVTFSWKDTNDKAIGLIAQEVKEVLPEIVNTDENGYLGIRYTNIIGVLVEAIKEQQVQIEYLKNKIENLNG